MENNFDVNEVDIVEGEIITSETYNLVLDVDSAVHTYRQMVAFVRRVMREDIDYGTIPGTAKPSLFKPGAEKLQRFFGLNVRMELVGSEERWESQLGFADFPLFHYRYTATITDRNGNVISMCDGEANSYETRYRWRWMDYPPKKYQMVIEDLDVEDTTIKEFTFVIQERETGGKWGKPEEYWNMLDELIADGTAIKTQRKTRSGKQMDAWEFPGKRYRIPNEDIYTQVNTIMKIAQKRAYVGAIILAANASEFFTQDIEDWGEAIDDPPNIYNYVPNKDDAARKLIEYAKSIGMGEDAGDKIKALFELHEVEWELENWPEVIKLIEDSIESTE